MRAPVADAGHTPWTDPSDLAPRLRELPAEPVALADALEELVIHHAVARQMGFGVPAYAEPDRDLRAVRKLLGALLGRDDRHLSIHRDLANYLYGTCHDFALLAIAALRERGVPARLRVGFASYFVPGKWEDHWVCEHRTGTGWAVLDAQLGPRARTGFKVGFDVGDVPDPAWRSAAATWRAMRSGALDPEICGVSFVPIQGAWFVASSVMRDAAALAGIELLPWDYWGLGLDMGKTRQVSPEQAEHIDALAAALDPAPPDRTAVAEVLDRLPWARPAGSVVSFPAGRPQDVALVAV